MKVLSYATLIAAGLSGTMVQADVPRVAADIVPVHGLVARVMQGLGEPDLVVPPGASPHGYAMRPSEALALERADAVFWMGEALTPWLEGPLATLAAEAEVVELMEVEGTLLYEFRTGATFDAHDHEDDSHEKAHGHETHADHGAEKDHGDHAQDGHAHDDDHEGMDPHAWLAPENARLWLMKVAEVLANQDPENAETYKANAIAGAAEIQTAVQQVNEILEPFRAQSFIVFHDAYQYFERSFGLDSAGAISLSDASDPSPARIAEIRDVVAERGVTCVFSEPQFNPGLVATVLDGTGAKTVVIDPIGTKIPTGPDYYTALILGLGEAMAGCR